MNNGCYVSWLYFHNVTNIFILNLAINKINAHLCVEGKLSTNIFIIIKGGMGAVFFFTENSGNVFYFVNKSKEDGFFNKSIREIISVTLS